MGDGLVNEGDQLTGWDNPMGQFDNLILGEKVSFLLSPDAGIPIPSSASIKKCFPGFAMLKHYKKGASSIIE